MERIGNINFVEKPHTLSCYRQIVGLVRKAYQNSFAVAIALDGFRTVTLYPSNLHVFDAQVTLYPSNLHVFDAHDCPEQTRCNNVTDLLENRCHILSVKKNSLSVVAKIRSASSSTSGVLPSDISSIRHIYCRHHEQPVNRRCLRKAFFTTTDLTNASTGK